MGEKKKGDPTKNLEIPEFLYPLFWDYKLYNIDIRQHATLIIARIMERGSWAAMIWLQKTYSKAEIGSFLEKKGKHILPPRELNYWAFMYGISNKKRQRWLKDAMERSDVWNTRYSR
jgi:hypothetical protein